MPFTSGERGLISARKTSRKAPKQSSVPAAGKAAGPRYNGQWIDQSVAPLGLLRAVGRGLCPVGQRTAPYVATLRSIRVVGQPVYRSGGLFLGTGPILGDDC